MIKIILLMILQTVFTATIYSQDDSDKYGNQDSTDVDLETLVEQTTEEEDSQLLDVCEKEKSTFEGVGFGRTSLEVRSRISQKIQKSEGYNDDKYLGTPLKSYQRIKMNRGKNISAGILLEKDAGERKVNDFTNGYIGYKSDGLISSFVLGDYIVEGGQGLSLWRGYDLRKGSNITAGTIREERGLTSHLSADENGFLRGVAAKFKLSNLSTILFYSQKYLSASIDSVNNVTSIYTTGYYRTASEIAKRSKLREILYGARAFYNFADNKRIGFTYYQSLFSNRLQLGGGNGFSGDKYSIVSLDYSLKLNEINIYGELSSHNRKYVSGLSGVLITPSKYVKIVSVYRNYSSKYFARYANPFGENTGSANEEGFYLGIELSPFKKINLSAYSDQFRFPKSFSICYPTMGSEYFIQVDNGVFPKMKLSLRYKRKSSDVSQKISDIANREIEIIDSEIKQNYRMNIDYRFSSAVKLRFRAEYVNLATQLTRKKETGILLYQNVDLKTNDRFDLEFRISYFKTDSYNSGVGEYENDLPGVLTIPIIYGEGVKWYALINYNICNSLRLSIKYSYLIREDVKKIGGGLDGLPSNYDNRIGLQFDFNL
jgi:hypothetical protein